MKKNAMAVVLILACGCDSSFVPYSDEWKQAALEREFESAFQKHQATPGATIRVEKLEISQIAVARDGDRIAITATYKNISPDQSATPWVFLRDGRDEAGNRIYSGSIPVPDGEGYENLRKHLQPGESIVATFYVRPKVKTAKTATLRLISDIDPDDSRRSKWMLTFDIPQ